MSEQATATEKQFQKPAHGQICWTELATKDLDAAKKFYTELLGWELKESNATDTMQYTEHTNNGVPQGGMYKMGEEFGEAPSHWMSYVAVNDVDATAAKVTELGGGVCVPPTDIPNVGRFCVINDPTGATISLITLKC
jgi:uncharacterized protein